MGLEKEFKVKNEGMFRFAAEFSDKEQIDYFIFGHRHLPLTLNVDDKATYINLGEWINYCTYAEFDGEKVNLKKWEN